MVTGSRVKYCSPIPSPLPSPPRPLQVAEDRFRSRHYLYKLNSEAARVPMANAKKRAWNGSTEVLGQTPAAGEHGTGATPALRVMLLEPVE